MVYVMVAWKAAKWGDWKAGKKGRGKVASMV